MKQPRAFYSSLIDQHQAPILEEPNPDEVNKLDDELVLIPKKTPVNHDTTRQLMLQSLLYLNGILSLRCAFNQS